VDQLFCIQTRWAHAGLETAGSKTWNRRSASSVSLTPRMLDTVCSESAAPCVAMLQPRPRQISTSPPVLCAPAPAPTSSSQPACLVACRSGVSQTEPLFGSGWRPFLPPI